MSKRKIGFEILLGFVLMIGCYFMYKHILFHYLSRTILFSYDHNIGVQFLVVLILTYLSRVLISVIQHRYLNSKHAKMLKLLYSLSLIYILFFKTIGMQGYDFNPLSFLREMKYGSISYPVMNIIFFMPIGLSVKHLKKNILLIICILFSIEIVQYIAHLGIFDLGDTVANFIGILIGYGINKLSIYQTLKERYIHE